MTKVFCKAIARLAIIISFTFISYVGYAQKTISQDVMQRVYNEVRAPHKYGLVITAPDGKMTDSPSVFRKGDMWYMYYIIFDGKGYETWMAESSNLLEWQTLGRVMSFSSQEDWDATQKAGYLALIDTKWGGSYKLNRYKGRHWMSYLGGNALGYEAGALAAGIAFTEADPTKPIEWQRMATPVLSPEDRDAGWWDNRVIYKSTVMRDKQQLTGHDFVMYYNAKGNAERIGMAVSDDMEHWQRYGKDPVIDHQRGISGDAYLQRMGKLWVMFYFGFSWNDETSNKAWDTFACSYDLVNWTDWQGKPLIEPTEPFDAQYAHKPCVVKYKGVVYHFYCAVDKAGRRGIAVAASKDMGKSSLEF